MENAYYEKAMNGSHFFGTKINIFFFFPTNSSNLYREVPNGKPETLKLQLVACRRAKHHASQAPAGLRQLTGVYTPPQSPTPRPPLGSWVMPSGPQDVLVHAELTDYL